MSYYMKLLKEHNNNNNINLTGGSIPIFENGFPNIIKKDIILKKKYEYNINSDLEKDKINIQQILIKRKEAQQPLININEEEEDYIVKKKQEEFTTNINIKDIF